MERRKVEGEKWGTKYGRVKWGEDIGKSVVTNVGREEWGEKIGV